ncbi:MAG: hypothetical protein EAZ91_14135 [Cytophagales bacterium]|nr:MAG: hypothetical protein EAZ91_14135 [Cytophagales bacterium]
MIRKQGSVLDELPTKAHISINWNSLSQFNFDKLGTEGIVLFQFLAFNCARQKPELEGWFYHSKDEIRKKLGINRERLDSLAKKLENMGLLEKRLRGVPARLFYRIRFDELTKPEKLILIYKRPTPEQIEELKELFQRCVDGIAPKTSTQVKAENIAKQRAENVLSGLVRQFQHRREGYNKESESTKLTRILENAPIATKPSQVTMVQNLLKHYTEEQIYQAFRPYCDVVNFSYGGVPANNRMPLDLEPPKRDTLSYFLSEKRDHEVFLRCSTASYSYGYTPSATTKPQREERPFEGESSDDLPF